MRTRPTYEVFDNNRPRFTVLVVEDNPDDEALTVRALRRSRLPLRVKVARDGKAALEQITAPDSELPQIVLLDLKLPFVNGLEVLKRIREDERATGVPVVVMSSSDEESDLMECYRLCGNSFVRKPVEFERYQEVVDKTVEYWIDVNRLPPAHDRQGTGSFDEPS